MILASISILLHSLGIYLLAAVSRRMSNQNILLVNMSVTELIFSICSISSVLFSMDFVPLIVLEIAEVLSSSFQIAFFTVLFCIAIDRFIGIMFPFKHRYIVTKHRIKRVSIIAWLISIVNGIIGVSLALTGHCQSLANLCKIVHVFFLHFGL